MSKGQKLINRPNVAQKRRRTASAQGARNRVLVYFVGAQMVTNSREILGKSVVLRKWSVVNVDLCGYKNVKHHTKQHFGGKGRAIWHKIRTNENACNTGLELFSVISAT